MARSKLTPAEIAERIAALGLDILLRDAAALEGRDPGFEPTAFSAGVMASPADTKDVAGLVRFCNASGIALVTHGGRTGLVGGTASALGMVLLSTERMEAIELIDPQGGVAVVQSGATLQALQEAAAAHGLEPGIDLGARGTATLGGMVSTNAGGIQAFRNGVMRHQVLGLEAVLANGDVFSDLKHVIKSTAGFDIKQMFIGAEGTLGVVTRVVLKLSPLPRARAVALLALENAAAGLVVSRKLQQIAGTSLRACEMMWRDYLLMNVAAHGARLPDAFAQSPATLLVEVDAETSEQATTILSEAIESVWEQANITDALIAKSIKEADQIWHLREDTSTIRRNYPGYKSFDISVPSPQIDAYCARMRERLTAAVPGLRPLVFGHIADGNIHVIPMRGNYDKATASAVETAIYTGLEEMGGSISAEHGIGVKKIDAYERFVSPVKRDVASKLKALMDPNGIFNPGIVVRDRVAQ